MKKANKFCCVFGNKHTCCVKLMIYEYTLGFVGYTQINR
jgi:hypothetical protein